MTSAVAAVLALSAVLVALNGNASVRRLHTRPPQQTGPLAGVLIGVAVVVGSDVEGVPPWVPLVVVAVVSGAAALRRRRAARLLRSARASEVSSFCFALSAELRAGRTPGEAMAAAAAQAPSLGPQLAAAARACRLGAAVDEELTVVSRTPGCERMLPVAAAWSATSATGSRIADVLQRIGSSFAAEDAARTELSAQVAGPHATVVVLSVLPLVAVAFGSALGASPTAYLFHTTAGWLLTATASALEAAGVAWMRRITNRALAA